MQSTKSLSGNNRQQISKVYSSELLGSTREIFIIHRGEEYRLRVTSSGKLLLTK